MADRHVTLHNEINHVMSKMPRITIITPNYNGARFLERCITSIIEQRNFSGQLEYILIDAESTDNSISIVEKYRSDIDAFICEQDKGPASAINKGLNRATGDYIAWLNADDYYYPGTLQRVMDAFSQHPGRALGFGRCHIVNEQEEEIRHGITRFKEAFFPISSRFTIQSINYISQPAMFFRRSTLEEVGPLREDLKAAWDYEFLLRLFQHGGFFIPGAPLAAFRWHESSISGQHFRLQFKEEYDAAVADAGRFTPQALLHWCVRWGIVGAYTLMASRRNKKTLRGATD